MFANLAQIILNWNFANIFQLKVIFYGTGIFVNRWPTAITNLFTLNNAYKSTLPKCNFGQSYVCKLKGNFRLQFDARDFLRLSYFDIWTWAYSIHKILICRADPSRCCWRQTMCCSSPAAPRASLVTCGLQQDVDPTKSFILSKLFVRFYFY